MALIGSPILLLELAMGRHWKKGEIDSMVREEHVHFPFPHALLFACTFFAK
jgi:SNF family Na+-dependent transporter